jgi:hypothetical protein
MTKNLSISVFFSFLEDSLLFFSLQFRNMIRKKAARKTDAYVSRETVDDSDESDESDVGSGERRSRLLSTGDERRSSNDRRSSTMSEADTEGRNSFTADGEIPMINYPVTNRRKRKS